MPHPADGISYRCLLRWLEKSEKTQNGKSKVGGDSRPQRELATVNGTQPFGTTPNIKLTCCQSRQRFVPRKGSRQIRSYKQHCGCETPPVHHPIHRSHSMRFPKPKHNKSQYHWSNVFDLPKVSKSCEPALR